MQRNGVNGNGHNGNGHNGNGNGNGNGHNGNGSVRLVRRDSDAPRHVLVIGGAGFVGSVLIPKLLDRDYDVTVLDAFLYGNDAVVEHAGRRRITFVRGDIRSVESVTRAARHADAVVHLGGLVGDPSCALDEDLTLGINLRSTGMIAEVARGLGIERLVFASSCAVYGASDGLLDETSDVAPVSTYARTKAESEQIIFDMATEEFAPTALRFGTFYGLSPRPRFDLVVNLLAAKAISEGSISIFGGGQWRPFIHVEDGSDAILAALDAPLDVVRGQAFNVGSQNHTLADVADMIASVTPGLEVVREKSADVEANYRVSFTKLQEQLGFDAQQTLLDGIRQIQDAVRSEEIADYQQAKYSNHKSLSLGNTVELLGRLAGPMPMPAVAS
jgi:nucleoside-diphosphate-sugar epimerase